MYNYVKQINNRYHTGLSLYLLIVLRQFLQILINFVFIGRKKTKVSLVGIFKRFFFFKRQ